MDTKNDTNNDRNEADRLRRAKHHELRNATAVSGAIVGATLGIIGGVVGVSAAALIGATVGILGGLVLERENRRTEVHDRALDQTIGVTSDSLGAAEIARESLSARETADAPLLALEAELDASPTEPHPARQTESLASATPRIEPPCADCVAVRTASANTVVWCARHAAHHPPAHLYYEYPQRFAVGAMLFRVDG